MFAISRRWLSGIVVLLASCSLEPRASAPGTRSGASTNSGAAPSETRAALSPPVSAPARPAFVAPYPRAAWRFVKTDDLDQVVLWFSQILVRHADARNEVPFVLGYWSSAPPQSTRTRADALSLAQQLAEQAGRAPGRFAELAREHSEDLPSRAEGGAVGGFKASVLMLWPQILDALAALQPGQSSQVVETKYGFHILQRSPPPPDTVMGGAHIVIGHEQAPWLSVFAVDAPPKRSREQALRLANELYRRASAEPDSFAAVAKEYSEHGDAVAGGDFGDWPIRDCASFPPRAKRLSELAIGQVGAPIETHLGFEIIRRTPVRPRQQYRAHLLVFPFDSFTDSAPSYVDTERKAARERADAVAQALVQDPASFSTLEVGRLVWQWEEGRELAPLSALLAKLEPGQITTKPVATEYGFVIAQRLPPEAVHPVAPKVELPTPDQPDLAHFFDSISAADSRKFLHEFAIRIQQELELTGAAAEQLRALHDLDERIADDTPYHLLMPMVQSVLEGTRQLLATNTYARYREVLSRDVAGILLGAPPDSPREQGF